MSLSPGPRMPWDEAYALASEVAAHLEPWCRRLKCVGSVRRRKPTVGDIEFVAEPHYSVDLLGEREPLIEPIRTALLEIGTWIKGADRMMVVSDVLGRPHVRLDLFLVHEPAAWGSQVAIRTGPADLGRYVVTECKARGFKHENGHARRLNTGLRVPTDTEEQFFALAGVPCVPPAQRDALAERLWADFHQRSAKR